MQIEVNGTRLWFDVDGEALVPDGPVMRPRPTVILVHGGPGSYDHSYFKPDFGRLTAIAQVVYLDLRALGRSQRGDEASWTFAQCADDVRAFADALGIERPIVLGHSMGGFIAILYGGRHPGHAGGLILLATLARLDLDRLVETYRRLAGEEVAELARRDFDLQPVTEEESARVFAAYGPNRPSSETMARRLGNPTLAAFGAPQLRNVDVTADLPRITSPTLVITGTLDAVTPISAAEEIIDGLRPGVGRLHALDDVGHFPWLDSPSLWPPIEAFIAEHEPD